MTNREKVIIGLKCCACGTCTRDCPYYHVDCPRSLAADALALLEALGASGEGGDPI